MTKLPPVEVHEVPRKTRQTLREWLREWELDRALCGADGDSVAAEADNEPVAPELRAAPVEEEPAPEVGQIRCLSPELTAARTRPLYVACLAEAPPDRLLVAPYGHLAVPGLPGELATGRASTPLRVLCLWNARPVLAAVLRRSWLADALSERELEEALAVYRALRGGTPPPDDLADRTGPPLSHPDDPRHAYAREAEGLMTDLEEGRTGPPAAIEYPRRPAFTAEELPKAAEPREQYGESGEPDR